MIDPLNPLVDFDQEVTLVTPETPPPTTEQLLEDGTPPTEEPLAEGLQRIEPPSLIILMKHKETQPPLGQFIGFKSAGRIFAGIYQGDNKVVPFSATGQEPPVFFFEEWFPLGIWS